MKDYSSRLAVAERRRLSSVSEQDGRPCLPLKVHERAADYAQVKSRGQQMDWMLHLVSLHFVTDSHSRVEIQAAVTQGHITRINQPFNETTLADPVRHGAFAVLDDQMDQISYAIVSEIS